MSAKPARKENSQASLPRLLEAAALELNGLTELGERLHDLVARQAPEAGPLRAAFVEDAQLIDFLVQHLDSLALFMRLVAEEAPDVAIDPDRLVRRLPLADLARRLADQPPLASESGDLDLF